MLKTNLMIKKKKIFDTMQTNYSEVYFVSPNWNPSIEAQAIARCHRIGQLLPVHVFRFSMNEPDELIKSMDQYILNVQEKKHLLIKDILP